MIKAPFNFVPLADKVFFPDWADQVSLDCPFSDGLDGYLTIEFTAQTPVFVRNGHTKAECESKNSEYNSAAVTPDGKYYLPASTVKGAIRNVLEILSFGKMRVDVNAMFAQREWDNNELYKIKDPRVQKSLCCGWLVRRADKYYIRKCEGTPYRINHKRIDQALGIDIFRSAFSKMGNIDLNQDQKIGQTTYDPKTAVYKYRLLEEAGISREMLRQYRFTQDPDFAVDFQENRVTIDPQGDICGTIVFTGQPDLAKWPDDNYQRQKGDGKFYEFVFCNSIEREIPLSQEEFEHFKFIYQDSDDWSYGKEQLEGDGIPVFFRMKGDEIRDFGLAFLYKLPYENSPADLEKSGNRYKGHSKDDCDLADCIFGFTRKQQSLKGRVHFSHFMSNNATLDRTYSLTLNSPKASYYPIYIKQDGRNGCTNRYKTYNDGRLAGWKRYHVRDSVWQSNTGDPKIDTDITPLAAGSTFSGRVYFSNLRPVEFGALLSAITFHGDTENCYHQMGQGKPYGFGCLSVKLTDICLDRKQSDYDKYGINYYLAVFERQMDQVVPRWNTSDPITQFFTLAHQKVSFDIAYQYMVLKMKNGKDAAVNEFVDAKKSFEFMQTFAELSKRQYSAMSHKGILDDLEVIKDGIKKDIEKLVCKKTDIRKYLKARDKENWTRAKKMFEEEVALLVEKLLKDENYVLYSTELDPIVEGEKATDILKIKAEIDAGPGNGPINDTLLEHIGKALSPDMVCMRISKWIEAGRSVEGEVLSIADKMQEAFSNKDIKPKEVKKQWLDEKKFEQKWKKFIDVVGHDVAWQVHQEIKKRY